MFGYSVLFFLLFISTMIHEQLQWNTNDQLAQQRTMDYIKAFHAADYALSTCEKKLNQAIESMQPLVIQKQWHTINNWPTHPMSRCRIKVLENVQFEKAYIIDAVGFASSQFSHQVYLQKQIGFSKEGLSVHSWQKLLRLEE